MRTIPGIVGLLALATLSILPAAHAGDARQSKALVRRMVEAINHRDFRALEAIIAPDVRRHSAATPGVTVTSREDFFQFLHQDLSAVPDAQQEIDFMLAEGDLVAGRFLYRGTQKGAWGPFPPSNRKVEIPFIGIIRVAGGRIAEIWVEWDNMNALQQLGHFAPPAAPASAEAER